MLITGLHSIEHLTHLNNKPISAISAPHGQKLQIREIQALGAISTPPNNYLSSQEHPTQCRLGSTSWIRFK